MAAIYIVEDDTNISEIERYACKNSAVPDGGIFVWAAVVFKA